MWPEAVVKCFVAIGAIGASLVLSRVIRTLVIYRRIRKIPGPPSESFLFGNTEESRCSNRLSVINKWSERYGSVLRRRLLHKHIIQVTDPALIAEACRSKDLDKTNPGKQAMSNFAGPHGYHTLLTGLSDARWKVVRKAVASAFSTSNMKAQFPNIRMACSQLMTVLKSLEIGTIVDMDNALCRESLDVIGRVGFGRDLGATKSLTEGDSPGQAMAATSAALVEAELSMLDPLRQYKIWRKDVRDGAAATMQFHKVMQGIVEAMRAEQPDPSSIAAHLLEIKDPSTGKPLEDKRLLPEVSTLFMAGFETTGHTAAWVLFAVCQHADVEAGIVEELRGLGLLASPQKPAPRPIEWDDIPQLTYLMATIKEVMRMYPVAGGATFRHSKSGKDVALCGGSFILPGGVDLHMPITAVHHAKDIWDCPYTFSPHRFLEDGAEDAKGVPLVNGRKPQRFLPFSQGSRDCVGQTLARLNLATTLAQLYGSFSFHLAPQMGGPPGVEASQRTAITLSCAKGMLMHVRSRV